MLFVGHLLKQVWAIVKEFYQMTFVRDIAQEICLQSCSRHISIYRDAFLGALVVCSTDFVESCSLYPSNINLASRLPWHII